MCMVSMYGIVIESNDRGNNNVVNQCLEHILRGYVHYITSQFPLLLLLTCTLHGLEFKVNTTYHRPLVGV